MLVFFVLFQAAGILWADARAPVAWLFAGSIFVTCGGCAARLMPVVARSGSARGWDAWLVLGLLAFLVGYSSHQQQLASASRDAAAIEGIDPAAHILVDARVASREAGRFGDRVVLRGLRSVESGDEILERAELRLGRGADEGQNGPSRADQLLWPGAEVRLGVRLNRLFSARNPGSPDWDRQRARSGLVARARLVDPDWVIERVASDPSPGLVRAYLERGRRHWQRGRAAALDEMPAGQGLARALVLGDRSGLGMNSQAAFRETGLGHLLAVSGLHVGFVAGMAAWLSRPAQRAFSRMRAHRPGGRVGVSSPFLVPVGVGTSAAVSYAWMTGAAISVARASLLLALFMLARHGGRRITPISALACIAAGLLWLSPASLFDLGARFSFTACLALAVSGLWGAAGQRELPDPASRPGSVAEGLVEGARLSLVGALAVSFGTLPWVAQIQGPLHPLSPVFNGLAIPWTGCVVLPASIVGVLGAEVLPEAWVAALLWPAGALERSVAWAATALPVVPPLLGLSFRMAMVCVLLGMIFVRRRSLGAALLLWLGVSVAGVTPSLDRHFDVPEPRAVFFDVGQGDAALIQSTASAWLIDTGPGPEDGSGGASLVRALAALGVRHLDVLVVTHADLDHRAGAKRVLETLSVASLWLPATGRDEASLSALAVIAERRGTVVRYVQAGDGGAVRDPLLEVEVLWPRRIVEHTSRNESSLVLRFQLGERSLLMMADVGHETERALLERPHRLGADVLKVGHHGSRGSSGSAFLEAVAPRWAILSAPCDATRGLPARSVIDRLAASGARLAWTGRDGATALALGMAGTGSDAIHVRPWASRRSCLSDRGKRGAPQT